MVNLIRSMAAAAGLASEPIDGTWDPVGDYSSNVQPPGRSDGPAPMNAVRAMGLPAVLRSIQLIGGMSAQLVMESWRGPELVTPQPSLVAQPDPWRSQDSFVERFAINLATDGNNFMRLHRQGNDVAAAECMNPFTTRATWERLRNSRRVVKRYYGVDNNGDSIELGAEDVIHTYWMEFPGLGRGLGPIGWCRAALTGIVDVREYADRWFREEAVDGVLSSDQRIDATAAGEYKRLWYDRAASDPLHGPRIRVMGAGLKYEPIMLRPEDAQWIEAQNFGILDVARMFGTPADYLTAAVEGNSLTYSNLEMVDAQFLRTTLFPSYLRKIEAAMTAITPRGQKTRFNTGALLRPDAKTRADIDAIYVPLGVYGRDEVRTREGIAGPAPTMPKTPAPAPAGSGAEQ